MTAHPAHLTVPKPFNRIRRFVRRVREMAAPKLTELSVHIAYDDEADVWYVAESDIPGLALEADNPQHLMDRVAACAPRLLELNQKPAPAKAARQPLAWKPVFDSALLVDA
jgi:hypothetical protein